MANATNAHDAAPSVYVNLLAAQLMVVRMRDYTRLVSSVIESLGGDDAQITIRPEALAWCVSHLADDLDEVAETLRWSREACAN